MTDAAHRRATIAAKPSRSLDDGGLRRAARSLAHHWPEYAIECAGLGAFMLSACVFVALLQYPGSPVAHVIVDDTLRRALIGVAMGATAIAIVYSPWGKQSGAHLNPAVTLTFYRLGKIDPWDAAFYVIAQFVGAIGGIALAALMLGRSLLSHSSVHYVVTVPGAAGDAVAFTAEAAISFVLMLAVLRISNDRSINRFTGLVAGALVAIYITLEAPVSGMSMNPARTFGSALSANTWTAIWIYFVAPLLGMIAAAETYVRMKGRDAVLCCKLHHDNNKRCIFHCRYGAPSNESAPIPHDRRLSDIGHRNG